MFHYMSFDGCEACGFPPVADKGRESTWYLCNPALKRWGGLRMWVALSPTVGQIMWRGAPGLAALLWVSAMTAQPASGGEQGGASGITVVAIEPLPLLKREGDLLIQTADVVIQGRPDNTRLSVEAICGGNKQTTELTEPIAPKKEGKEQFLAFAREVTVPTEIEFVVKADGRVIHRKKLTWQPQRHWEVQLG
jgi:hypothetical protein